MTMFFAKKLNKKGFTLAELLIVVAIIAVLVAIAIPLFTSEIQKARVARDKANARNIKAVAVAEILDNTKGFDLEGKAGWVITASITEDGKIDIKKIEGKTSVADVSAATPEYGLFKYDKDASVEILLEAIELSSVSYVSMEKSAG